VIDDRQLWSCASQVLRQHGDGVDLFIAERVAALAAVGDQAGVQAWVAIAERVDLLRDQVGRGRVRH
jgi:hypothetical protein